MTHGPFFLHSTVTIYCMFPNIKLSFYKKSGQKSDESILKHLFYYSQCSIQYHTSKCYIMPKENLKSCIFNKCTTTSCTLRFLLKYYVPPCSMSSFTITPCYSSNAVLSAFPYCPPLHLHLLPSQSEAWKLHHGLCLMLP